MSIAHYVTICAKVTQGGIISFQTYSDDEDYLGLGLEAGRIKLVWNLGWYSRSEVLTSIKYNDGHWHTISIERYEIICYIRTP